MRYRRLLIVQITLSLPAGVKLDDVIPDWTSSRETAPRPIRACPRPTPIPASLLSQLTDPGAFHGAPAEAFDLQLDRRPDRPRRWREFEGLRNVDAVLRDGFAVNERSHFVHTAVVLGNREARVEPPVRIDGELLRACWCVSEYFLPRKW